MIHRMSAGKPWTPRGINHVIGPLALNRRNFIPIVAILHGFDIPGHAALTAAQGFEINRGAPVPSEKCPDRVGNEVT